MTVYLVGAGPGDPGLLTLRAHALLTRADVVLHDGLVDARVLALAPPAAEVVDVAKAHGGTACSLGQPAGQRTGRTRGSAGVAQGRINALLVEWGRTAGCVVRLKGGDPFVFGRGGEEALALAAAGVPFEIVPGVSSAVAAPAYAGIPVTHRGVARSVAVVTGHEAAGGARGAEGWAALAQAADTLVILMGVARLAEICAGLLAGGRPPDTPAAAVERGTTADQRVLVTTLADLPERAAVFGLRSPAVVVVGEVVRLRAQLAWFASGRGTTSGVRTATEYARQEAPACA